MGSTWISSHFIKSYRISNGSSFVNQPEKQGMNKCRLTTLIRLSYLAPDIVRALLEGRQPIELTPTRLLRLSKDLPHDWSEQRHVLGFDA